MTCLATADWHLTHKTPSSYIGTHLDNMWGAVDQACTLFKDLKPDYFVIPGDIFNESDAQHSILTELFKKFRYYGINKDNLLCIWGNHDSEFNSMSRRNNTALGVINSALGNRLVDERICYIDQDITLEEAYDDIKKAELVILHRYVDTVPNPYIANALTTDELEDIMPDNVKVIVTGDNHKFFVKDRIINPGCLYKRRIKETVGKAVYFDTNDDKVIRYYNIDDHSEFKVKNEIEEILNRSFDTVDSEAQQVSIYAHINSSEIEKDVKEYLLKVEKIVKAQETVISK